MYLTFLTTDCFSQLMRELKYLPSASALLPELGDTGVNGMVLSLATRVLACLWYLGTPGSFRSTTKK